MNAKRDIYGVTSILSLSKFAKSLPWMKIIKQYILSNADKYFTETQKVKQFKAIMASKKVGLLVNERLVNIPPNVVPPLHEQLPGDLDFTKEQEDIEDPAEFDYDYLVVISKFTVPLDVQGVGKPDFYPKRRDRLYFRWEDDLLEQKAEFSFIFQSTFKEVASDGTKTYFQGVTGQASGGDELQFRLIYMIKWEEYVKAIPLMKRALEQ
uniref:Uncharacterized protein n=1 Tax=Strombidium rassoulzadegani TaxID=1082188 RepID=A0A7S3FTD8_9SPIT|mmetsp:Transcript_14063/g.23884  ORF Transcript_14063/g.23884 Transcript_14063/m.23884 type:complete len:209 (+) Transcript_14063:741-1367(+)